MGNSERDEKLIRFGIQVRELRRKLNLSQEELAEKSEMHRTYIGMVERGEKSISLSKIFKLADALETDVKNLF